MHKKSQKKSKKVAKPTAKRPSAIYSKTDKDQEAVIHDLENVVSELYQDFPLAQTLSSLTDGKQMSKMIAALSGTLDSLHIEDLTQGLFSDPKEDARFAKDLTSILHSLKNLSTIVNDNMSESVE